jgi:hypothetical protein
MDEVNHRGQPKRRRVLRARDVIPPFDRIVLPPDREGPEVEAPIQRSAPAAPPARADAGAAARPLPGDAGEIPTYDLAENILAEQRRAAGRRRRAPGRMGDAPIASPQEVGIRAFIPETASQDLLELQRIVAEIVARDIERLCKRPAGRESRKQGSMVAASAPPVLP